MDFYVAATGASILGVALRPLPRTGFGCFTIRT